jgi:DNA-binding Lrp family transcriptional regulator
MAQNNPEGGAPRRDLEQFDATILRSLGENPQASKAQLAKALNVTLPWLTARIQGLHSRGAIRIRPVLNIHKAGRLFVFCKLAINSENLEAALLKLTAVTEFVTVSSIVGGKYNAFVYFTFGDMDELHHIIRNLLMKIDNLSELETSIISDSLISKPEYLNYGRSTYKHSVAENAQILGKEAAKCGLDALDIAIISEMQCDERKSLRAIAREYNVSPGTVRYRLQRLEAEGIIGFISFVDPLEVSLQCFMILELRIDPNATSTIVKHLSGKPWLGHLLEVVGASDLIAFLDVRDMREAQSVISDHIRSLPGIRTISVRILMDTFKLDPRWGFLRPPA